MVIPAEEWFCENKKNREKGPGLQKELLALIDNRYATEKALFTASGHAGGTDLRDHLRESSRWYREPGAISFSP